MVEAGRFVDGLKRAARGFYYGVHSVEKPI